MKILKSCFFFGGGSGFLWVETLLFPFQEVAKGSERKGAAETTYEGSRCWKKKCDLQPSRNFQLHGVFTLALWAVEIQLEKLELESGAAEKIHLRLKVLEDKSWQAVFLR